jgi:hypothetical protein
VFCGVGDYLVVESGDSGINISALHHAVAIRKGRTVKGGIMMSPHFVGKFP